MRGGITSIGAIISCRDYGQSYLLVCCAVQSGNSMSFRLNVLLPSELQNKRRMQQPQSPLFAPCCWLLFTWLTVSPWRWRKYSPPKHATASIELHGVITKKIIIAFSMNILSITRFTIDLWRRNDYTKQKIPFLCPLKIKINRKEKEITKKIFGRMWKFQTLHGRFDNLCKQAELPLPPRPQSHCFCLRSKYIEKIRSAELRGLACFPFPSTCYSNIYFRSDSPRGWPFLPRHNWHILSLSLNKVSHVCICWQNWLHFVQLQCGQRWDLLTFQSTVVSIYTTCCNITVLCPYNSHTKERWPVGPCDAECFLWGRI
jgi:hypothetical protein